jgi:hypothetical protein
MRKLLIACVVLMAMLPVGAVARGRGHRHVIVRPAIVPYGSFGYGWYGSYDPFWNPYQYRPYVFNRSNDGKVKIETKAKDAKVYINGAFAGTVGDLKTMTLKSGSYKIEVRNPGGQSYGEQVYVVPGKTIRLYPVLDAGDGS